MKINSSKYLRFFIAIVIFLMLSDTKLVKLFLIKQLQQSLYQQVLQIINILR